MEHGRAYIKILFMMTQWELDRTSARAMFVFCKLVIIQCANVCRILQKRKVFLSQIRKIRFSKFIGPRGQGNKLIINRYKATTILA